jgi:hypothetical protein
MTLPTFSRLEGLHGNGKREFKRIGGVTATMYGEDPKERRRALKEIDVVFASATKV